MLIKVRELLLTSVPMLFKVMQARISTEKVSQILLFFFPLILGWKFELSFNEADVLALARAYADPEWLPNDWYVRLPSGYRSLFNVLVGYPLKWFGMEVGVPLLRAILLLLFGGILIRIQKVSALPLLLFMFTFLVFFRNQSLMAEEWMVGGIEAKVLAYLSLWVALLSGHDKKAARTGLFVGLALSFHVLVGIWGAFALLITMIIRHKQYADLWKRWPVMILTGLLGGVYGIVFIIQHLTQPTIPGMETAWDLYVNFRVPHHLLFSSFPYSGRRAFFLACAFLLASFAWNRRTGFLSELRLFALASVVPAVIGILLQITNNELLLRFYWFRLADTFIMFTALLFVADAIWRLIKKTVNEKIGVSSWRDASVTLLIIVVSTVMTLKEYSPQLWNDREVHQWIRKQSLPEDAFLINPANSGFYFKSNRCQFVSFKHFPQSAEPILEWKRRLDLCGGSQLKQKGFAFREAIKKNYQLLTAEEIRAICEKEGLTYALFSVKGGLKPDLPIAYVDDSAVIYGPFMSSNEP